MVQQNLRQAEIPLDYGACEVEDKSANHCKVIAQEEPTDGYMSDSELGASDPTVCKVHTFVTGSRRGRTWTATRRDNYGFTCYTCGKQGHGYKACPDWVCSGCHSRGYDVTTCRFVRRDKYQNKRASGRGYVKAVKRGPLGDEKAASITVKILGRETRTFVRYRGQCQRDGQANSE